MSERADLATTCSEPFHRSSGGHNKRCGGGRPLPPAEALTVLLPDVDWEALRGSVARWTGDFPSREDCRPQFEVARRLLAVYDGKDG